MAITRFVQQLLESVRYHEHDNIDTFKTQKKIRNGAALLVRGRREC